MWYGNDAGWCSDAGATTNGRSFTNGEAPTVVYCLGDSITNGYPYGLGGHQQAIEKTYTWVLKRNFDYQFEVGKYTVIKHGITGRMANGSLWGLRKN